MIMSESQRLTFTPRSYPSRHIAHRISSGPERYCRRRPSLCLTPRHCLPRPLLRHIATRPRDTSAAGNWQRGGDWKAVKRAGLEGGRTKWRETGRREAGRTGIRTAVGVLCFPACYEAGAARGRVLAKSKAPPRPGRLTGPRWDGQNKGITCGYKRHSVLPASVIEPGPIFNGSRIPGERKGRVEERKGWQRDRGVGGKGSEARNSQKSVLSSLLIGHCRQFIGSRPQTL